MLKPHSSITRLLPFYQVFFVRRLFNLLLQARHAVRTACHHASMRLAAAVNSSGLANAHYKKIRPHALHLMPLSNSISASKRVLFSYTASLSPLQRHKAFTLLEMILVATIITILVGIAIPAHQGLLANAKAQKAQTVVQAVIQAKRGYQAAASQTERAAFSAADNMTRFMLIRNRIAVAGVVPSNMAALLSSTGHSGIIINDFDVPPQFSD